MKGQHSFPPAGDATNKSADRQNCAVSGLPFPAPAHAFPAVSGWQINRDLPFHASSFSTFADDCMVGGGGLAQLLLFIQAFCDFSLYWIAFVP